MNINSKYFLQSAPIKVVWCGFESDTLTLQRCGWKISAEQDVMSMNVRIAIKHPFKSLYGVSKMTRMYFEDTFHERGYGIFEINDITSNYQVQLLERSFNFKPIDAEPAYIESHPMEHFAFFREPLLNPEHSIVVADQSVEELLNKILELQDPMLKKYYNEQVLKQNYNKKVEQINMPKIVTQVISFDRKAA
jgi:hypothetical protein